MRIIGIDPGEEHFGFAAIDIQKTSVRFESRVYKVSAHSGYIRMVEDLFDLLPHARPTHIVCENFRIRRSGHQAFSQGLTLRMIGAIEYAAWKTRRFTVSFIEPNSEGFKETGQLFGKSLDHYRKAWPSPRSGVWGHGYSAWRCLGWYLFKHHRAQLMKIRDQRTVRVCQHWLPVAAKSTQELVAPAAELVYKRST